MIQESDIKVLAELNRLVARHGPEPFIRMAKILRDPERASQLANVIEHAAQNAVPAKSESRRRRTDRIGIGVLNELRMTNPAKHAIIADIRTLLIHDRILKSMSDIRQFAMIHNLSIGKATSRSTAIVPLLRSLSFLPVESLKEIRKSLDDGYSIDDRSLSRWRDVIVRK